MANLLPAGFSEETISTAEAGTGKPTGYRSGIAWENDFARDGKNQVQDADGITSWKQWIDNCIHTERFKHRAYHTDFGIELDKVFAASNREEGESILVREITEAILADPYGRTAYIDRIDITWDEPDGVVVDLTVVGITNVSIDLTAYLTKGGV